MDGCVILHFKDGRLKTKMTLKGDALIATELSSCHPVDVPTLTDHTKGKKHIAIVDKRKNFKPKSKPSTEESTESSGKTIISNEPSQKTLEMHFRNADCIKAEIIWTLKSVLGGFSVRAMMT